MHAPQLRVYHGPDDRSAETTIDGHQPTVTVRLGEILPLLADAYFSRRTWLSDLADDPVTISADLHEILLAYAYWRRPSA